MANLSPAEIIKPISWLTGKWTAICAKGKYPTIKPFEYSDNLEFTFNGQPMLNYTSKTWIDNKPKHIETGFLRINPGTNKVAFLLAHNFGVVTLEEGEVSGCEMKTTTTEINRVSFAKEPAVCKIVRHYKLCEDKLELVLSMETDRTPLTEHLRAVYKKEC